MSITQQIRILRKLLKKGELLPGDYAIVWSEEVQLFDVYKIGRQKVFFCGGDAELRAAHKRAMRCRLDDLSKLSEAVWRAKQNERAGRNRNGTWKSWISSEEAAAQQLETAIKKAEAAENEPA